MSLESNPVRAKESSRHRRVKVDAGLAKARTRQLGGLELLLDEIETAAVIKCRPESLANARSTGRGELASLPFLKIGRLIRYDPEDVRAWLAKRRQEIAP